MNEVKSYVFRPTCIVKIYRGIPIKNNEYRQYIDMAPCELVKRVKTYYSFENLNLQCYKGVQ